MSSRSLSKTAALVVVVLTSFAAAAADQKPSGKPAENPASWKPGIKAQHDAIRAMPAEPKDGVLAAIRKLAAQGPDARPAIMSLAADTTLPEPHRAWSGILGVSYARFDVPALRAFAESHKNPFARREAVDLLADIGGAANKAFLEGLSKKDATLGAYIAKALARAPATESIAEQDRKLLSDILLEPVERKRSATVILVDRHQGKTTIDAQLEKLASLSVADSDTQIHAGVALSRIHGNDVPKLKALTARNKHRFIRYNAMQQLAKNGPAGEAVLRELLATPDEPLKPFIEKWLAK